MGDAYFIPFKAARRRTKKDIFWFDSFVKEASATKNELYKKQNMKKPFYWTKIINYSDYYENKEHKLKLIEDKNETNIKFYNKKMKYK